MVIGRPTFAGYCSMFPWPPGTVGKGMKPTLAAPMVSCLGSATLASAQLPMYSIAALPVRNG